MVSFLAAVLLAASPLLDQTLRFVDARLKGVEPSESMARFVDYAQNAANDRFVHNPRFWLKGIDFSCVSPWNSGGGRTRAGTAISKRHIIFSKHFPLWPGVRILFVGEDGGVCPCTVKAVRALEKGDIAIGLLNAELTPNIRPAKILPEDYAAHIGNGAIFPVITFNQHEEALLTQLVQLPPAQGGMKSAFSVEPHRPFWRAFRKTIVSGDSGNPAFLLIDHEPVLIYCLKIGGCGSGPAVHIFRREIQAAMDELCPGYKLECFDFSVIGRR